MNIYSSNDIKANIKVSDYLESQGVPLRNGRTRAVAIWRGGNDPSVAVDDDKGAWYDHKAGQGGSVIDAFVTIEGGTPLDAIRTLGDRYNITPTKVSRARQRVTRGEMLIRDGYALTVTYTYTDEDGVPLYFVDRYEKTDSDGKRDKTFVQRSPTAENLDGVRRVIYNLPAVIKATDVIVVEGEKDVETLRRMNLTATTNSGGGKFWQTDFNAAFANKRVIIIPDNDEVGETHAASLYAQLKPIAASCKICKVSNLPKGDVTDYIEKEGGTLASLMEKLAAATEPAVTEDASVARAREANTEPLLNYAFDGIVVDKRGNPHPRKVPRRVDEICDDIHTRFLEFPRRLGGVLFDYTRNRDPRKRRIQPILNKNELRAWVDGTSGQQSEFTSGANYASWDVCFARLTQTAVAYNGIAAAPWFPNRADVFPTFEMLPPADPTHARLDELLAFFNPATPADRTLLCAFFMSPMFFDGHSDRPAWCIDTVDAQQSGKTSIVKACAALYNEIYLDMDLKTVNGDLNALKKRVLSSEGRSKRIALFDNLETTLKSGNLAQLITNAAITGMAPYGHGEETRVNDITWVATVNGADVDTDMATRTYTIHITKPAAYKPRWARELHAFIEANRAQIHADMIHAMTNAPERVRDGSRFAAFDACVLSAASRNDAEFAAACDKIAQSAAAANEDLDRAAEIAELILNALANYPYETTHIKTDTPLIIRSVDMDEILRRSSGALRNWTSKRVRRLVKTGCVECFDRDFERADTSPFRSVLGKARAFLFYPSAEISREMPTEAQLIAFTNGVPKAVAEGVLTVKRGQ